MPSARLSFSTLRSGGTLLDFNPPDYREFVKAQKEMWNSRNKGSEVRSQSSFWRTETSTGAAATSS